LHMKTTTSPRQPLKLSKETISPLMLSNRKSGAEVPRGNMVLAVRTINK
jgi:hypothetical protein